MPRDNCCGVGHVEGIRTGSGDSPAKLGLYYAQAVSRFDRESTPAPLPLTPDVSWQSKQQGEGTMEQTAILSVVTEAQLGSKGLVVTVNQDGNILGHLMVGNAHIVWFEKSAKKKGRKVSWGDFHEWVMQKPEVKATRP